MPRNYGSVSNTNWLPSNGKRFSYPDGTMKIGWLQSCPQYPNAEIHCCSLGEGTASYDEKAGGCQGCGEPKTDSIVAHKTFEAWCVLLQPNLPVARETPKSDSSVVVRHSSCIAMCRARFFLCPTCTKRAELVMRTSDHLAIGSSWMEMASEVHQILTDTEWNNPNAAKWIWEINTQFWSNEIGTKPHVYDGPDADY